MGTNDLKIKVFHINKVSINDYIKINDDELFITDGLIDYDEDFLDISIKILPPKNHNIYVNNIMDVLPISTKVLGDLGNGITHTLTGVKVVMTGTIKNGEQMRGFGSSDGILSEHILFNRVGTPNSNDYIILINLEAPEGTKLTRKLCLKMYKIVDQYIQGIREKLKMLLGSNATETYIYEEKSNLMSEKPKVALVKQVAGQGAMYDMLLFPEEPSGFNGGVSIIDLENMPIFLTPNEYRDGAIRAMV